MTTQERDDDTSRREALQAALAGTSDEEPFFFGSDGHELFGVMHNAHGTRRRAAFVFCAPFVEEKLWAHRVLVSFARELASSGHPVLRFDYRGTGDSSGNHEEASPQACVADIGAALDVLRQRAAPEDGVALLGLRFGATLAAIAAERAPDVRQLVLWQPILRGADYMQELLRINLATQVALYREVRHDRDALVRSMRSGRTVNVDGYELTCAMHDEMSAIDLLNGSTSLPARCLVAQIAPRPVAVPAPELERLASRYADGSAVVAVEDPFWKEIKPLYSRAERLYDETHRWLGHEAHAG